MMPARKQCLLDAAGVGNKITVRYVVVPVSFLQFVVANMLNHAVLLLLLLLAAAQANFAHICGMC